MTKKIWTQGVILLAFMLLVCAFASADLAAVSQLGYHPNSNKQVVVYTSASSGSFDIRDAGSNAVVATFTLQIGDTEIRTHLDHRIEKVGLVFLPHRLRLIHRRVMNERRVVEASQFPDGGPEECETVPPVGAETHKDKIHRFLARLISTST